MMPSERTMKPVPSPLLSPDSATTFTTAGSTARTTPTTRPVPVSIVDELLDGKFAAGEPLAFGCVVELSVPPAVHAENASAATTPSARMTRFMVTSPVCRVQAGFGTRLAHVHRRA